MGYLLLAISLASSVPAFRFWMKFWAPRVRHQLDLADLPVVTGDWIDLVSIVLPSRPRRIWNGLLVAGIWVVMGIPHHLVLWSVSQPRPVNPWFYAHYLWALPLWLACLALPTVVLSRHRLARSVAAPTPDRLANRQFSAGCSCAERLLSRGPCCLWLPAQ